MSHFEFFRVILSHNTFGPHDAAPYDTVFFNDWNFMHLCYFSHLLTASREIPLQSWISEFKLGDYDITEEHQS